MRILFFSPYYLPHISGLTKYPHNLLQKLAQQHTITVLTFLHQSTLPSIEHCGDIKIFRMPFQFRLSKGFISLTSIGYFLRFLQNNDSVFINLPNVEGLLLALIAKVMKKKLVVLFHCEVALEKNLHNFLPTVLLRITTYLQLYLAEKIIANEDYVKGHNLFSKLRIKCVFSYPIVHIASPDTAKKQYLLNKKKGSIWIGFAGRIASEKGIEYLIQGISIFMKRYPSHKPISLIFAGPGNVIGEDGYKDRVLKLLQTYHINRIFLTECNDSELVSFYQSIDILALPSVEKTEAFGMVQVEAMLSAGTPIIASDLPGVRFPIRKTGLGILVPPKNPEAIASAINAIITDFKNYRSASIHNMVKSEFQNPKSTDKIVELFY